MASGRGHPEGGGLVLRIVSENYLAVSELE